MSQFSSADGTGAAASFHSPLGVASDGEGNLFVADTYNHTIRKLVLATGPSPRSRAAASGTAAPTGRAPAPGSTARRHRQRRGGQPLRRRRPATHHPEARDRHRGRHHARGRGGPAGSADGTGADARFDRAAAPSPATAPATSTSPTAADPEDRPRDGRRHHVRRLPGPRGSRGRDRHRRLYG